MNFEVNEMSSNDIKTLILLLQVRKHNNGAKNDFLEKQIQDLISSLKIQGADLEEIVNICTRYDYKV